MCPCDISIHTRRPILSKRSRLQPFSNRHEPDKQRKKMEKKILTAFPPPISESKYASLQMKRWKGTATIQAASAAA